MQHVSNLEKKKSNEINSCGLVDPDRDSMEKALQCPLLEIKSYAHLHRLSNNTIDSAATIGPCNVDMGIVPTCPCDPLTYSCT